MMRQSSRVLLSVASLGLVLVLTACGDDDETAEPADTTPTTATSEPTTSTSPEESDEPEPEPEPVGTTIDVTFVGGKVTPAGERVEVEVGEEIVFAISADEPGELHAHTTEELTLSYPAGVSEQVMVIDQPGVVEVESHDLGVVIVQLQAS